MTVIGYLYSDKKSKEIMRENILKKEKVNVSEINAIRKIFSLNVLQFLFSSHFKFFFSSI